MNRVSPGVDFHPVNSRTAFAAFALRLGVVVGTTGAARPNIMIILNDDPGYNDLGRYGQMIIQTPNLDRMVAEGMRFTQFYA